MPEGELTELQKQVFRFYEDNSFIYFIHAHPIVEANGQVALTLTVDEQHVNLHGISHGGVLMTMADTAMGAVAMLQNKKVVTISIGVDFMHAVPMTTTIYARGKILHDGQRIMTCESEITDDAGKVYAKAHGTFYVLGHFVET